MKDIKTQLAALGAQTATFNSSVLDFGSGGTPHRGVHAEITVQAVTGTAPTLAVKAQHSDDNSTYTDLAFAHTASITAAGLYSLSFDTPKRYVRLVNTIGGTTPSFTMAEDLVVSRP